MKWSDGAPFTADDIMFFVDDLLNNSEFYPTAPARFVVAGETMQAEKIDDFTVKFIFAAPYGTFLTELATPLAQEPVLWAKHYCQQFHPTYNEDVQAMVDVESPLWRTGHRCSASTAARSRLRTAGRTPSARRWIRGS